MEAEKSLTELTEIEISLEDTVKGRKLTPETVDLPTLRQFLEEVEALVKGNAQGKPLDGSQVQITEGSVKVKLMAATWLVSSFMSDMDKLAAAGDLDSIQPQRAKIIQTWQKRADKNPLRSYGVKGAKDNGKVIKITHDSRFEHSREKAWVKVEKYLQGKVVDLGGKQRPNVHLRLTGSGREVMVAATETQLSEERENRLYKEVTLRVNAEQNIVSKELRDVHLLEFLPLSDEADEEALTQLWEKGRQAWKDVPSATGWVEAMRGH